MRDRRALGMLDDSKQRTPDEREELYPCVIRAVARSTVTIRCVRGIDSPRPPQHQPLGARLAASSGSRATCPASSASSDGFRLGPRCSVEHRAVVDGDAKSAAIAAASVIAKVTRDRYMHRIAGAYPEFGFDGNVGYSTPEHRAAIIEHGLDPTAARSRRSRTRLQLASRLSGRCGAWAWLGSSGAGRDVLVPAERRER